MNTKKKQYLQPKTQNDILHILQQKTNLPINQLKEIENSLWNNIRLYLTNPLNCKKGVLINGWGLFYIKEFNLKKVIDHVQNDDTVSSGKTQFYLDLYKQMFGKDYGSETKTS